MGMTLAKRQLSPGGALLFPVGSRAYTQDIGGTVPVFWSGLWEGGWQSPDVD